MKLESLKQQHTRTLTEAQEHLNNTELRDAESKDRYARLLATADDLQRQIDQLSSVERKIESYGINKSTPAPASTIVYASPEEKRSRLNAAYRSYLTHGHDASRLEQRDLSTSSDGTSLVPQLFEPSYADSLRFYGPLGMLVKNVQQTTGQPRKLVTSDDTASTMNYLPDTGAIASTEADPSLASRIAGLSTLVSIVKYSVQQFDDSFDLGDFIRDIAGVRVARAVEYALTTGKDNGTNTQMANTVTGGLLATVATGAATSTLAAGLGYEDFVNLISSVDHSYYAAPGSGFMASPATFTYLLGQKDSTGRPYYNVDPATGLLQIAGKPLYVNAAMPDYTAASSKVCLFGDFSRSLAYVHTGLSIQVLKERYIDQFERAAVITHRLGTATLVPGAVKALVTAAS